MKCFGHIGLVKLCVRLGLLSKSTFFLHLSNIPSLLLGAFILSSTLNANDAIPLPPTGVEANKESIRLEPHLGPGERKYHALKTLSRLQNEFLYKRIEMFEKEFDKENTFGIPEHVFENLKDIKLRGGDKYSIPLAHIKKLAESNKPKEAWAALRLLIEMEDFLRGSKVINTDAFTDKALRSSFWNSKNPGSEIARYFQGILFATDKTVGLGFEPEISVEMGELIQNTDASDELLIKLGNKVLEHQLKGSSPQKALRAASKEIGIEPVIESMLAKQEKLNLDKTLTRPRFSVEHMLAAGVVGAGASLALKHGLKYGFAKYRDYCKRTMIQLAPEYLEDTPLKEVVKLEPKLAVAPPELRIRKKQRSRFPTREDIEKASGITFPEWSPVYTLGYWVTVPPTLLFLGTTAAVHLGGFNPIQMTRSIPLLHDVYLNTAMAGVASFPITLIGTAIQTFEGGGFSTSYTNYNRWRFRLLFNKDSKDSIPDGLKMELDPQPAE